jgi:hypothetical protein
MARFIIVACDIMANTVTTARASSTPQFLGLRMHNRAIVTTKETVAKATIMPVPNGSDNKSIAADYAYQPLQEWWALDRRVTPKSGGEQSKTSGEAVKT